MSIPKPALRVLQKRILFQFEDDQVNLQDGKHRVKGFKEVTDSGIIVVNSPNRMTEQARWGIVIKAGPDCCEDIKAGGRILIEKLMWTNGAKFDGQEYWVTDEEKVLLVDNSAVE